MSNKSAKITYRNNTTGTTYKMFMIGAVNFHIYVYNKKEISHISRIYDCEFPYRNTINMFFDLVETHINTGKWEK